MSSYDELIEKLDAFIRKYYKNLLIKGAIYFLSIGLVDYLLVTVLEYYGRFTSPVRAALFFSSLAILVLVFSRFVLVPLAGLFRIGKRINHEEASRIIGAHFGEVKDKLLNTLQLRHMASKDASVAGLIEASIRQKSEELHPIPFVQAIDFSANRRYLKYLVIPLLVGVALFFVNARIMREGTMRLVQYDKEFASEAPFQFVILNKELKGNQNEESEIRLALRGDEIPNEVFIELDGKRYKMTQGEGNEHHYTVRNLQKDFDIVFEASGYRSDTYAFEVRAKALMAALRIR
ncbi:MAG: hypothetical protein LPK45_06345, partial [Bacteroidota bacterium]|nr:hypothetical protein [Bacteroidota bacterium]MDX5430692.1 hypothetical protein [Bacteroidota bacterium]MDX5469439.1 hypothetical protein [Bacteroidota bacterium]